MLTPRRKLSIFVTTVLVLSASPQFALGRGSMASENPWNAAHLDNLPPEIRVEVLKWESSCGGSVAAAHLFALHLAIPGTRFLALHFEDLQCANRSALCNGKGCLHEIYATTNSHYRRVLSVHARDIRMFKTGDAASVEISEEAGAPFILRWNGVRFSRVDIDKATTIQRSKTGTFK